MRTVSESRSLQIGQDGAIDDSTEPKKTESTSFYQYTYDESGNWTERRRLYVDPATNSAKCQTIERRTLQYW